MEYASVLHQLLSTLFGNKLRSVQEPIKLPPAPPHAPATDDRDAWRLYWKTHKQPWRTEPEIDMKRQEVLNQRLAIIPDVEQGIYLFKGIKLNRADVEWLLATYENGDGPVDWSEGHQRERKGLDLRGADLRQVDQRNLPLAGLSGGELSRGEMLSAKNEHRDIAGIHLEEADLSWTHLEGANLYRAHLEGANLYRAHLEETDLRLAHLEGARLYGTHLEGASLYRAHLEGTELNGAFLDATTRLREVILGNKQLGTVSVAGVHWDDVDLTVVDWSHVRCLGDECLAHEPKKRSGERKDAATRLEEYQRAVRANSKLAVALQLQGLNEEATQFAYRARRLQKTVLWIRMTQYRMNIGERTRMIGAWLFSWFLFLLTGYGYRPGRSFLAYFLMIAMFTVTYYLLGQTVSPPFSPFSAFIFSMTSFHGRGFFPVADIPIDSPLTALAALEATFIATLTQRLFGR